MYVCLCKAVTEDKLKKELSLTRGCPAQEVFKRLGVGLDCGQCLGHACEVVDDNSVSPPKAARSKKRRKI